MMDKNNIIDGCRELGKFLKCSERVAWRLARMNIFSCHVVKLHLTKSVRKTGSPDIEQLNFYKTEVLKGLVNYILKQNG